MPFLKGPIAAFHRFLPHKQRSFNDVPVARGVLSEEDMVRSGRPMRVAKHTDDCLCRECRLRRRSVTQDTIKS